MRRFITVCLLLLFCAAPAFADETVSLKVGYLSLTPSGKLAGNKGSVGAKIDIENDMNLDDSQNVTAEAALQFGNLRLSLGYMPIEYSGDGQMTISGTYNGQNFSIGDPVSTKLKLNLYDAGLTFYLINMDDLPVRVQLGPEVAVKLVDAKVDFVDSLAGIDAHDSGTAAIPTIGGRARIGLSDFVAVIARAGYLEYDNNHFLDAEAQVEFSPLPMVGVYAGYRTFQLKVDQSDIFVDADMKGPFIGAMVRF